MIPASKPTLSVARGEVKVEKLYPPLPAAQGQARFPARDWSGNAHTRAADVCVTVTMFFFRAPLPGLSVWPKEPLSPDADRPLVFPALDDD